MPLQTRAQFDWGLEPPGPPGPPGPPSYEPSPLLNSDYAPSYSDYAPSYSDPVWKPRRIDWRDKHLGRYFYRMPALGTLDELAGLSASSGQGAPFTTYPQNAVSVPDAARQAGLEGFVGQRTWQPVRNALTRRYGPVVPVFAGASRGFRNGSGESKNAARITNFLRDNGVNAVFVNTNQDALNSEAASGKLLGTMRSANAPADLDSVVAAAEKAGVPRRQFMRAYNSGVLDDYSVPELLDNLKLMGRSALDPRAVLPLATAARRFGPEGDIPNPQGMFDAARGMSYFDATRPGDAMYYPEIGNPWNPDLQTKNLAMVTGFNVNYAPHSSFQENGSAEKSILPALALPYGRTRKQRIDDVARGRKYLRDTVMGLDPADTRSVVMIPGGMGGASTSDQLRDVVNALPYSVGNLRDAHILVQAGRQASDPTSDFSKYMATLPEGIRSRVRVLGQLPQQDYLRVLNGVDGIYGYGGSSSVSEVLGGSTPAAFPVLEVGNGTIPYYMFPTPYEPRFRNLQLVPGAEYGDKLVTPLNSDNALWGERYFGLDTVGIPARRVNASTYAVRPDPRRLAEVMDRLLDPDSGARDAAISRGIRFTDAAATRNQDFLAQMRHLTGYAPDAGVDPRIRRIDRGLNYARRGAAGAGVAGGLYGMYGLYKAIKNAKRKDNTPLWATR